MGKKDHSVKDLLARAAQQRAEALAKGSPIARAAERPPPFAEPALAPIIKAFMEALTGSLRSDIQAIRQDLTAELKETRRDILDIENCVAALEDSGDVRGNKLEMLCKETMTLKDQLLDL